MENALRTFIALPGQIYIFLMCVCIFYFKKEKPKPLRYTTSWGTEQQEQKPTTKQNKEAKCIPLPLSPPAPGADWKVFRSWGRSRGWQNRLHTPGPCQEEPLCTCWWRIQLSRLGLWLFFNFALYVCACISVYMCIYIYVCVRVCMCIYTCIYKYIYICS